MFVNELRHILSTEFLLEEGKMLHRARFTSDGLEECCPVGFGPMEFVWIALITDSHKMSHDSTQRMLAICEKNMSIKYLIEIVCSGKQHKL